MPTHADKYVNYCFGIAKEFEGRLNRMRVFVTHNLSSGTANEIILRDFLASHSPTDFFVGQGFICDPTEEDRVSKQCDILVYKQSDIPVVYEDGPIKIVWPKAARVVVEVKTDLSGNSIESAINNIESVRKLNSFTEGFIFGFSSSLPRTIARRVKESLLSVSSNHYPTAILLFHEGIIIHQTGDPDIYAVRSAKEGEDKSAIVVTYFLLAFFNLIWKTSKEIHGADPYTLLHDMLNKYTDEIDTINIKNEENGD